MINKTIRIYLAGSGGMFLAQSFFFATYQMFLLGQGLSYLEMNLVNLAYMLSAFIFEIPTGAYADVFGRRKSVIMGCLILSLSFLVYFLSDNFWLFILAEIIGALGSTFISGALEAWMVDQLKKDGYQGQLEKIYQKEGIVRLLAIMAGSLAGAWLGKYNLAWPWLASALSMLLLAGYIYRYLPEKNFQSAHLKCDLSAISSVAKDSLNYGYRHRGIFYLMALSICLAMSFQAFNMYWPMVFSDYNLDIFALGLIFNGIAVFNFIGSQLTPRFARLIGQEKKALLISQIITVAGMMAASSALGYYPVLSGFMLHEIGRGMFRPLKQAYLNRRIPDEKRATVLSFESMLRQLGAGLGLIISGLIADSFSLQITWVVSMLIAFVSLIVFSFLKNGDHGKS